MTKENNPLWAVRFFKRLMKVAVLLMVVAALLWVGWFLLPESDPEFRLGISTNAVVYADGKSLGAGSVVLEGDGLLAVGTRVARHTEVHAIVAKLFPEFEFRGPLGVSADTLWKSGAGMEVFLYSSKNEMLVRRLFLFKLPEEWLAVALEFRHPEHVRSNATTQNFTYGWSLSSSFSKHYTENRFAKVDGVAGELPGLDEIVIGPLNWR
ncbi:MAG: hypothetical protein L3J82_01555 [Planctomycetes bacterium]|nr:hypothetical protein [Planctomycetota bacterium]